MSTIKIREQGPTAAGFEAVLQLPGGEYPITITDPFNTQAEQNLEWYFEHWLKFPFLDTIKAREIAATIPSYGEQLFQQVFRQNFNAYSQKPHG